MKVVPLPISDGVDHINVYTKGATSLGKALSNLARIELTHPRYGRWPSVENLWYWLSTGKRAHLEDEFRQCSPWDAKRIGTPMERVKYPEFEQEILEAIEFKIKQNQWLADELKESTLPLTHYFVYGNADAHGNYKVIDLSERYAWQLNHICTIRQELQGNRNEQL